MTRRRISGTKKRIVKKPLLNTEAKNQIISQARLNKNIMSSNDIIRINPNIKSTSLSKITKVTLVEFKPNEAKVVILPEKLDEVLYINDTQVTIKGKTYYNNSGIVYGDSINYKIAEGSIILIPVEKNMMDSIFEEIDIDDSETSRIIAIVVLLILAILVVCAYFFYNSKKYIKVKEYVVKKNNSIKNSIKNLVKKKEQTPAKV